MRRARTWTALAAALPLLLGATGCGGTDEITDKAVEKALERQLEGAGEGDVDIDFDSDSGDLKIETDDGTITAGGELPPDFPSDDVPLVEGQVVQAIGGADGMGGFLIILERPGSADEAMAEAVELLEEAGYTPDSDMVAAGITQLSSDAYDVVVAAADPSGTATVTYNIAKKP